MPVLKLGTIGKALAAGAVNNNNKNHRIYSIIIEVTTCPTAVVPAEPAEIVNAPPESMVPPSDPATPPEVVVTCPY